MMAIIRVLRRLILKRSRTSGRPITLRFSSCLTADLTLSITPSPQNLCVRHLAMAPIYHTTNITPQMRDARSGRPIFIANTVKRFDIVEFLVEGANFPAQTLDVAVDCTIIEEN